MDHIVVDSPVSKNQPNTTPYLNIDNIKLINTKTIDLNDLDFDYVLSNEDNENND